MGGYQCTCDRGFKPNDIHSACLGMIYINKSVLEDALQHFRFNLYTVLLGSLL